MSSIQQQFSFYQFKIVKLEHLLVHSEWKRKRWFGMCFIRVSKLCQMWTHLLIHVLRTAKRNLHGLRIKIEIFKVKWVSFRLRITITHWSQNEQMENFHFALAIEFWIDSQSQRMEWKIFPFSQNGLNHWFVVHCLVVGSFRLFNSIYTLHYVMLGEGDCVVVNNNKNEKKRKTKPKIKPKSKCWTNKWKRTQHTSGQERTKYTETKMKRGKR